MPRIFLAVIAALALFPLASHAQQLRGLEFAGGWYGWTGGDFDGVDPGFRGELSLWGENSERLGVGVVGLWGDVPVAGSDASVNEWGLLIALRVALTDPESVHLFLEGRAGWTRLSFDGGPSLGAVAEDGIALGPGVGLEVPLGSRLRLVAGGDINWHSYSEVEFGGITVSGPAVSESGWRYGGRVGLHVFF